MEKECFGWKKIERKESIRHSLIATKFHLKMTLLNFWILLTQKGYFRIKKNENYHQILHIQINLQSFSYYFETF